MKLEGIFEFEIPQCAACSLEMGGPFHIGDNKSSRENETISQKNFRPSASVRLALRTASVLRYTI